MLGRATFTIVSSSTSMSCAVAMTSRAMPSLGEAGAGALAAAVLSVLSLIDMACSVLQAAGLAAGDQTFIAAYFGPHTSR
jgi:hypothetical protein